MKKMNKGVYIYLTGGGCIRVAATSRCCCGVLCVQYMYYAYIIYICIIYQYKILCWMEPFASDKLHVVRHGTLPKRWCNV